MAISPTLERLLDEERVPYRLVRHVHTPSSSRSAEAAHVPGDRVAKAVALEDEAGCLVAVIPSTHAVHFETLERLLDRRLHLVPEARLPELFADCEPGAVPPLAGAYGLPVIVDECLLEEPKLYLESGDHRQLVEIAGEAFARLTAGAPRGRFSARP